MRSIVFASAAALSLLACAKKPKPTVVSEPEPPVVAPAPANPAPSQDDARARIKALLEQALRPVYFPFDQATLSEDSKRLLAEAGGLLRQEPSITLTIQGNADERGTSEYNLALGEKRAGVVRDYLTAYGIDGSRLRIISYGEEKPAVEGSHEDAWSMNRRDEFVVD
jgi:peptidoglycan-associated lipoprotein